MYRIMSRLSNTHQNLPNYQVLPVLVIHMNYRYLPNVILIKRKYDLSTKHVKTTSNFSVNHLDILEYQQML